MARVALTDGVLGAMTGIHGIPECFISKLNNEERFIPGEFASQGEYLWYTVMERSE